jgi:hypothetical protein
MASGLFIGSYTMGKKNLHPNLGVFFGPLLGGSMYDLFERHDMVTNKFNSFRLKTASDIQR